MTSEAEELAKCICRYLLSERTIGRQEVKKVEFDIARAISILETSEAIHLEVSHDAIRGLGNLNINED